jgi:hypothetical protein
MVRPLPCKIVLPQLSLRKVVSTDIQGVTCYPFPSTLAQQSLKRWFETHTGVDQFCCGLSMVSPNPTVFCYLVLLFSALFRNNHDFNLLLGLQPCHLRESLSCSTKSGQTLSIAKDWVDDCVAKHQHCNSFTKERLWYPTRLLDCGSLGSSETCCRLIETNEASLDERYMTVSHCWGRTDCLKLTTSNYAKFLKTIPLPLLPQLYQDAVYITRHLGIRYLWIDSLCIIQEGDELQDWSREAEVMGQVYSNSYCNISAANAPNSDHTLFYTRNPEPFVPQTIALTADGCIHAYHVSDYRFWDTEVSSALINTRGWVLQERLMSPRVLHFGERQMLWECRQKDATEVCPDGLSHENLQSVTRLKDLFPNRLIVNNRSNSKDVATYNY